MSVKLRSPSHLYPKAKAKAMSSTSSPKSGITYSLEVERTLEEGITLYDLTLMVKKGPELILSFIPDNSEALIASVKSGRREGYEWRPPNGNFGFGLTSWLGSHIPDRVWWECRSHGNGEAGSLRVTTPYDKSFEQMMQAIADLE